MRAFGFLILLFAAAPLWPLRVAFLPFVNQSGYRGQWALERDIPHYLAKNLRPGFTAVDADSAFRTAKGRKGDAERLSPDQKRALARAMNADVLVMGSITEFTVRKLVMGEGKFGGVKNYLGKIAVKVSIFAATEDKTLFKDVIEIEKKETVTAVNLGKLSDDEAQFDQLNTEKFGSPLFEKTVAGQMMQAFGDKLNNSLTLAGTGQAAAPDKKLLKTAKIVDLTDLDVYINAGLDDGVEKGDVYSVFTPGDSLRDPDTGAFLGMSEKFVGKIRIAAVTASHFSRAEVAEKKEPFKRLDMVRVEK